MLDPKIRTMVGCVEASHCSISHARFQVMIGLDPSLEVSRSARYLEKACAIYRRQEEAKRYV